MKFGYLLAAVQSVLSVIEVQEPGIYRKEDLQRGLLRLFSVNSETFEKLYLALCQSGLVRVVDPWTFEFSKPHCLIQVVRIYLKATHNPDKMAFFSVEPRVAQELIALSEIFQAHGKPLDKKKNKAVGVVSGEMLTLMQSELVAKAQEQGLKVDSMTFVRASQLDAPIQKSQEEDGVCLVVAKDEWCGLARFLKLHGELRELLPQH